MATVAKIQAQLDLDSGQFTGQITSAIGSVKNFSTALNNSSKSIQNIERRVTGFGASVRDAMVVLGQFRGSMLTLWSGTGQWVAAIIKANAELERMNALLKGVAKGDEQTRIGQAAKDLNYLIDLAQHAPFSIGAIGDSLVKLRSAGLDAQNVMNGITDAVAAFGGNDETLKRATIALQQMAGKGVVSMEELRQQLGEAVPTAMSLMARGLGVSMGDLTKQVSKGTVEAKSAISAMINEMKREYEGSASAMMNTWTGMTARLKTQWMLFAQQIGDAGLFNAAKDALGQLTKTLSDPNTLNSAKQLGLALGNLIKTLAEGTSWVIQNQSAIIAWGKAISSVVVGGYILSLVKNMSMWSNILTGMQGSLRNNTGATKNFLGAWSGASNLVRVQAILGGVGGALNGLLTTLTGFSGPVGAAIVAIGALIGWLVKLQAEAQQTRRDVAAALSMKANDFMSDDQYKSVTDTLNNYTVSLNKAKEARQLLAQAEAQGYSNSITVQQLKKALTESARMSGNDEILDKIMLKPGDWGKRIDELEGYLKPRVNQLATNIQKSIKNKSLFDQGQFVESNAEVLGRNIDNIRGKYQQMEVDLEESAKKGNWTQEKLSNERNTLLKNETDAQIAEYDRQIGILKNSTGKMNQEEAAKTNALIKELTTRKTSAQKLSNDILAARETGIVNISAPGPDKNALKKAKAEADSLQNLLETLSGKNAQLTAQLDGDVIPSLAKFNELLDGQKKWGSNPDPGTVKAIRKLLEANDELSKSVKKNKATEKINSDLDEMAAKASADVISAGVKASGDVYSQVAAGMVGFNRQTEVLRANLGKTNMSVKEFEQRVAMIKEDLQKVDMIRFSDFVQEQTFKDNTAALDERHARLAEYNETLRQYEILRNNLKTGNAANDEVVDKGVDALISSATRRFQYENRTAWQQWIDQYKDITDEMGQIWANAMDGMAQSFTDFAVEGKGTFKDLIKTILSQVVKLLASQAISQFASLFSGMIGGGGATTGAYSGLMSGFGNNVSGFIASANGNIVDKSGARRLHKYAKGGIADSPQLSLFGEGDMPEAYVPLPDGRSIPVTMNGNNGGGGSNLQNNIGITVNIDSSGNASTNVEADTKSGKDLGMLMEASARKTINQEMAPGGIIYKMLKG